MLFLDYSRNWTLDFLIERPLVVRIGKDLAPRYPPIRSGTPQGCYLGTKHFTHRTNGDDCNSRHPSLGTATSHRQREDLSREPLGLNSFPRTPFIHSVAGNVQRKSRGTLPTQLVLRHNLRHNWADGRITPRTLFYNSCSETDEHDNPFCTFIDFTNILTFLCIVYFGSFICFIL